MRRSLAALALAAVLGLLAGCPDDGASVRSEGSSGGGSGSGSGPGGSDLGTQSADKDTAGRLRKPGQAAGGARLA